MQRFASKKRLAAGLATVSIAAAMAMAAGAPAQASTPVPKDSLTFTVDYIHTTIPGNPTFGASFVGNGTVTDSGGNQIGTADDHCDEDQITFQAVTVQCNSVISLSDGEIDITSVAPIPILQTAYPYSFDGIIQGGTGSYDGAQGDARITAKEPGLYKVTLSFR